MYSVLAFDHLGMQERLRGTEPHWALAVCKTYKAFCQTALLAISRTLSCDNGLAPAM